MRFLSIYKTVETNTPPSLEHMTRMGQLIEESMKAGVLLATEGCLPSASGARVRLSNGKITVTDNKLVWISDRDEVNYFRCSERNPQRNEVAPNREDPSGPQTNPPFAFASPGW